MREERWRCYCHNKAWRANPLALGWQPLGLGEKKMTHKAKGRGSSQETYKLQYQMLGDIGRNGESKQERILGTMYHFFPYSLHMDIHPSENNTSICYIQAQLTYSLFHLSQICFFSDLLENFTVITPILHRLMSYSQF